MKYNFLAVLACLPCVSMAHPYIAVTTDIAVAPSGANSADITITWTYEEAFSLVLLGELGIDPLDSLTRDDAHNLQSYVTGWPEGFEGDLYILDGDRSTLLGDSESRRNHTVDVVAGQIVEQFVRTIPTNNATLIVQNYDPFFVTDYTIQSAVATQGCTAVLLKADRAAAQANLDALIAQMPEDTVEMAFPEVGIQFADAVRIGCD